MSKTQKNARKAAYEAKQEREGKKVVEWIIAILILMAVAYTVYISLAYGHWVFCFHHFIIK